MISTLVGLVGFYILTELGTIIFNKKAEKLLFENDLFKLDDQETTEEWADSIDPIPLKERIESVFEEVLENFPITNLFLAYTSYLDIREFVRKESINQEISDVPTKTSEIRQQEEQDVKPTIIIFKYQEQEKKGEILYYIYDGMPRIINATTEFASLSLLEQAAKVRGEYQEFKNGLPETWRDEIDHVLSSPEEMNGLEDFLDRENVFVGNLKSISAGKLETTPFEMDGRKSYINPKILKQR